MGAKILYAEDELFLGKIVKESLESRGYTVLMEEDGNKVLTQFKQFNPDVCVLDVMLPHKDGFSIAEDIRNINPHIPLIFLTAKTQVEDLARGFNAGGNDYMRKPFSIEELILRIENVLKQKTKTRAGDQLLDVRMGEYNFHSNHQVLKHGNEEKKLSFREAELLKMLYLNRDKVIDRREILNEIWGNDNFFNSRNLDVYITRLRSYLKKDTKIQVITIKGVGYRFVVG